MGKYRCGRFLDTIDKSKSDVQIEILDEIFNRKVRN